MGDTRKLWSGSSEWRFLQLTKLLLNSPSKYKRQRKQSSSIISNDTRQGGVIKNDVCFQTKMFYVFLFVLFFPNCCDNLKKLRIMWAIITFYCLYFFAVWHWMIVIYLLNDNKFKIILPFKLLTVLWCFMIEWEIGHSLDHI